MIVLYNITYAAIVLPMYYLSFTIIITITTFVLVWNDFGAKQYKNNTNNVGFVELVLKLYHRTRKCSDLFRLNRSD